MQRRRANDAERQASRWIARLEASDVSLEDHRRFRGWLNASPENRAAYEAVSRSFDHLDLLKGDPSLVDMLGTDAAGRRPQSRRALIAGLASVALIGAGAAVFWALPAGDSQAYETSIGGRTTIALANVGAVELGAASRVVFNAKQRRVTLERGEALFTSTAGPLFVATPLGELYGTHCAFLVKLALNLARITVIAGALTVRTTGATRLLNVNEEAVLNGATLVGRSIEATQVAQRLGWRSGMLAFDGEPLREAVSDVERQTGVKFRFADPALGDTAVGGYINGRDAESFVSLMESSLSLHATRQADGEILLSR